MKLIRCLLIAVIFFIPSCSPVGLIVGAGAAAGSAAMEERPIDVVTSDLRISADIQTAFLDLGTDYFSALSITVREGVVLIVGEVAKPEQRLQAVRIAWKTAGVGRVIDEIRVGASGDSFTHATRDAKIAAELKTRMTLDKNIFAVNYAIDVSRGTVYLLGIAQSQAELDRAIRLAKSIAYVKRVQSFVRVKNAAGRN